MSEKQDQPTPDDLLYEAWAVIANAGWDGAGKGGNAEAAVRWRDKWHAYLDETTAALVGEPVEGSGE